MSDAVTSVGDLKLYNKEIQTGMYEGLATNLDTFNEATGNAILLGSDDLTGNYSKEAFYTALTNPIVYRDPTADAAVDSKKFEQEEIIGVNVPCRIGPYQYKPSAIKRIGQSPEAFFQNMGRQIGEYKVKLMRDLALGSVRAALQSDSTMFINHAYGETGVEDMDLVLIADTIAKMLDQRGALKNIAIHSTPFAELVGDAMATYQIDTVAGSTIVQGGIPGALGVPTLNVNCDYLKASTTGGYDYYTLFLVEGAVMVNEVANSTTMWLEKVTGNTNLKYELQGEFNLELKVRGYKWDTVNGGTNPDFSTLTTSGNWDKAVSDSLNGPGAICATYTAD